MMRLWRKATANSPRLAIGKDCIELDAGIDLHEWVCDGHPTNSRLSWTRCC